MKIARVLLCVLVAANLPAENLETILAHMDKAALSFKAVSADMKKTTFTKVVGDTATETGTLKMQRQKTKGTRAILEFSGQADARVVAFFDNKVRFYNPKLKLYQDYEMANSSDLLNQYLLLGFGSSGKELKESYEITSNGEETISKQEATKLVLTPKAARIKEKLSKVEVWIMRGAAYPAQERFFFPSGDLWTVVYSNIKLNPPIKGNLEFKLPAGARKQGS